MAAKLCYMDTDSFVYEIEQIHRANVFENKKHEVYTVNKHKIVMNRDYDKRLVQADGITTLARGYVALSA